MEPVTAKSNALYAMPPQTTSQASLNPYPDSPKTSKTPFYSTGAWDVPTGWQTASAERKHRSIEDWEYPLGPVPLFRSHRRNANTEYVDSGSRPRLVLHHSCGLIQFSVGVEDRSSQLGRSRASSEIVMLLWRCLVWNWMLLYTFNLIGMTFTIDCWRVLDC